MRTLFYLFITFLITLLVSCSTIQEKPKEKKGSAPTPPPKKAKVEEDDGYKFTPPKANSLKGTNTELMNAFKSLLGRYEFETFDLVNLKIVTKATKMEESNPNYAKYKSGAKLYEKYEIKMTKEGYDMMIDLKYTVLAEELNMKSGALEIKEIARVKETEEELLEKVKRLLYQY